MNLYKGPLTILKYQPTKSKIVRMLTTYHHAPVVAKTHGYNPASKKVGEVYKPTPIVTYNQHKFGVDIFDSLNSKYSYAPKTKRWSLRLFFW